MKLEEALVLAFLCLLHLLCVAHVIFAFCRIHGNQYSETPSHRKQNDCSHWEKSVDMKESSVYNSSHIYLDTQHRVI